METKAHRIVVVGTCASGKSTLVEALRSRGLDAYACAQEHSEVKTLWKHLLPDHVVFLETDLATIRERRSPNWPETIFNLQITRLENAKAAAKVVVDTSMTSVDETVEKVLAAFGPDDRFVASE